MTATTLRQLSACAALITATFASLPALAQTSLPAGETAPVERTLSMRPLNPQPLPPYHGSIGSSGQR